MVLRKAREVPAEAIPPAIRDRLQQTAWCKAILGDPDLTPVTTEARAVKPDHEDSLLSETLNTEATIPFWQAFYKPLPDSSNGPWAELQVIVGVGHGLDGHPKLAHGGFISFVLDEAITQLAAYHRPSRLAGFTKLLTTDFQKPIPTPGTVLIKVWLEARSERRKSWLKANIEDGNGAVFATAESLVIEVKDDSSKL